MRINIFSFKNGILNFAFFAKDGKLSLPSSSDRQIHSTKSYFFLIRYSRHNTACSCPPIIIILVEVLIFSLILNLNSLVYKLLFSKILEPSGVHSRAVFPFFASLCLMLLSRISFFICNDKSLRPLNRSIIRLHHLLVFLEQRLPH